VEEFSKAIVLNPKSNHAFFNRGACYWSLKKYDLARKDFEEALRLDPHDEDARDALEKLERR
jgi:tetratricopeptide (TPR) repeat protein